jgi:hypothetical protein
VGNAAFLLAAVGLSILGSLLLWLRSRQPKNSMSSVDDFQREMRALGRDGDDGPTRGRPTPGSRSPERS